MPISPYDVLAPYQKWERTRRLDRWAQLHADPPAQTAQTLEVPQPPTPSEPDFSDELTGKADDSPTLQPAAPASPQTPVQHRFYDQIIRKHTAAAKNAFTPTMHRL